MANITIPRLNFGLLPGPNGDWIILNFDIFKSNKCHNNRRHHKVLHNIKGLRVEMQRIVNWPDTGYPASTRLELLCVQDDTFKVKLVKRAHARWGAWHDDQLRDFIL